MTHYTMAYVPGVVRCEDLEATLLAAAANPQLAMIVEEDPTEVFEEDDVEGEDPYDEEDYDQEYEYYLEYMDYLEQSYD